MKKINFEKLGSSDLFESFASKKLEVGITSLMSGGRVGSSETSTSLCSTLETSADKDDNPKAENLKDSSCSGYPPPPVS